MRSYTDPAGAGFLSGRVGGGMGTIGDRQSAEFLREWLSGYEQSRREFELSLTGLDDDQREEVATTNGFRTWRIHKHCADHIGLIQRRFVEEDAFKKLWAALSKYDALHQGFAFSPAWGGVPATILRKVQNWYCTPKFTPSERKNHALKIVNACDDLLYLLRQVTPSEIGNDRFATFQHFEPWQTDLLFAAFKSPPDIVRKKLNGSDHPMHAKSFIRFVLGKAGITPISAIESIRLAASHDQASTKLPTKLKAKGAARTYFIHATNDAINNSTAMISHSGSIISTQLMADLVSLIADTDCTADDVRKALKEKPEHSGIETG